MALVSRIGFDHCVNLNFSVFSEVFPEQEKKIANSTIRGR